MEKRKIEVGKEYALREPVKAGAAFQRVRVLENVRGSNWRVEWIDPNPGLVDFTTSKNLVVLWTQRTAFLRDERNAESLASVVRDRFPGNDSPIASAVDEVFNSMGERTGLMIWGGILRYEPEAIGRVAKRAGIETPSHHAGYRDRHGQHYLPFECALALAQAFAAAEPRTVLDHLDILERDAVQQAREPGASYLSGLLSEWRASWALVRQWAGHDAAIASREERILELERLLTQAMWDLRRPGADSERIANRIDRALRP